jgi:hypothetical protein
MSRSFYWEQTPPSTLSGTFDANKRKKMFWDFDHTSPSIEDNMIFEQENFYKNLHPHNKFNAVETKI